VCGCNNYDFQGVNYILTNTITSCIVKFILRFFHVLDPEGQVALPINLKTLTD